MFTIKKTLKLVSEHALKHEVVNVVLLTAYRGSSNYGLHKEGVSDTDAVCFYLPSKEKLLLSAPQRPKKVQLSNSLEYELVDVRNLLSRADKANLSAFDFLWSPSTLVNPLASDLWAFLKENGFSLLKSRVNRLAVSQLGQFNRTCLKGGYEDSSTPKSLVQAFYFLQLSSLLLDVKKPEKFFRLAKHADQWHKEFKHPDLMEVKFSESPRGKEQLFVEATTLSLDLYERTLPLKDPELDNNKYYKALQNEVVKLVLDVANAT